MDGWTGDDVTELPWHLGHHPRYAANDKYLTDQTLLFWKPLDITRDSFLSLAEKGLS